MHETQHIDAEPLLGITPEQARDARVWALRLVLTYYDKKKSARPGGPDEGTKFKEDSADASII